MEEGFGEFSVPEGKRVNVWMSITGYPYPKICWTFNNKEVSGGEDIILMSGGNKHLMSISRAARKHQGIYTITAVNEAGKDTKGVSVNVYGK